MFEANTSTRRVRRAAGENDEEGNASSDGRSKMNEDEDNSDVEAADDVGTLAERATSNKLDEQEYDDGDVLEEGKDKSMADLAEDNEDEKEEKEDEEGQEDEGVQDLEEGQEAEDELEVEDKIEMDKPRLDKVIDSDKTKGWIIDYEYDTAKELCRLTLSGS